MWYNRVKENSEIIDYTYLYNLFGNQQEAVGFLHVFVKEFETARVALHTAIVQQDGEAFQKIHHNIRPHLEILKINHLGDLLHQVKDKLNNTAQPFDDRALFAAAISQAFEQLIQKIQEKLSTVR